MKTILNCKEKKCYFSYCREDFKVDLTEGDLEDCWTSVVSSNGVMKDVNFSWGEGTDCPVLTIYGLKENEEGIIETDFEDYYTFEFDEIIGDYNDYIN